MSWPKCPKCRSDEVIITEFWKNETITWEKDYLRDEGILEPGHPYMVMGDCKSCGHKWRFRGIVQINPDWWNE